MNLTTLSNALGHAENAVQKLGSFIQENPKTALALGALYFVWKNPKTTLLLGAGALAATYYQTEITDYINQLAQSELGQEFAQTTLGQSIDAYLVDWISDATPYVGGSFNPLNWF